MYTLTYPDPIPHAAEAVVVVDDEDKAGRGSIVACLDTAVAERCGDERTQDVSQNYIYIILHGPKAVGAWHTVCQP